MGNTTYSASSLEEMDDAPKPNKNARKKVLTAKAKKTPLEPVTVTVKTKSVEVKKKPLIKEPSFFRKILNWWRL